MFGHYVNVKCQLKIGVLAVTLHTFFFLKDPPCTFLLAGRNAIKIQGMHTQTYGHTGTEDASA